LTFELELPCLECMNVTLLITETCRIDSTIKMLTHESFIIYICNNSFLAVLLLIANDLLVSYIHENHAVKINVLFEVCDSYPCN
jgi:hypothetical protein